MSIEKNKVFFSFQFSNKHLLIYQKSTRKLLYQIYFIILNIDKFTS